MYGVALIPKLDNGDMMASEELLADQKTRWTIAITRSKSISSLARLKKLTLFEIFDDNGADAENTNC